MEPDSTSVRRSNMSTSSTRKSTRLRKTTLLENGAISPNTRDNNYINGVLNITPSNSSNSSFSSEGRSLWLEKTPEEIVDFYRKLGPEWTNKFEKTDLTFSPGSPWYNTEIIPGSGIPRVPNMSREPVGSYNSLSLRNRTKHTTDLNKYTMDSPSVKKGFIPYGLTPKYSQSNHIGSNNFNTSSINNTSSYYTKSVNTITNYISITITKVFSVLCILFKTIYPNRNETITMTSQQQHHQTSSNHAQFVNHSSYLVPNNFEYKTSVKRNGPRYQSSAAAVAAAATKSTNSSTSSTSESVTTTSYFYKTTNIINNITSLISNRFVTNENQSITNVDGAATAAVSSRSSHWWKYLLLLILTLLLGYWMFCPLSAGLGSSENKFSTSDQTFMTTLSNYGKDLMYVPMVAVEKVRSIPYTVGEKLSVIPNTVVDKLSGVPNTIGTMAYGASTNVWNGLLFIPTVFFGVLSSIASPFLGIFQNNSNKTHQYMGEDCSAEVKSIKSEMLLLQSNLNEKINIISQKLNEKQNCCDKLPISLTIEEVHKYVNTMLTPDMLKNKLDNAYVTKFDLDMMATDIKQMREKIETTSRRETLNATILEEIKQNIKHDLLQMISHQMNLQKLELDTLIDNNLKEIINQNNIIINNNNNQNAKQVKNNERLNILDGNVNIDELIEERIKMALAVYDADKTGLTDFALESAGGYVIDIRCTETYTVKEPYYYIFGFPLWRRDSNPRKAIQPGLLPGDCWAFRGAVGCLVLRLSHNIRITQFSMEHIPKSLTPNGKVDSAPKKFIVLGLKDKHDQNPTYLGEFMYNPDGPTLQFFDALAVPDSFNTIELKIQSNWGNLEYTCLYRFRVHGKLATPSYTSPEEDINTFSTSASTGAANFNRHHADDNKYNPV